MVGVCPAQCLVSELLDRYEEVLLPERAPRTQETYGHSLQAARTYFVEQGGDPGTHEVRPGHVQDFLYWRRTRSPDGTTRKTPLTPSEPRQGSRRTPRGVRVR